MWLSGDHTLPIIEPLYYLTFLYYPTQADQCAVGTSIGLLIRSPNVSLCHWSSATGHFMLAISNLFCDNFGCGKASCHRTIRWSQLPPPIAIAYKYCFILLYCSIQVNLGGNTECLWIDLVTQWKQFSKLSWVIGSIEDPIGVATLQIVSMEGCVVFERWYSPNLW